MLMVMERAVKRQRTIPPLALEPIVTAEQNRLVGRARLGYRNGMYECFNGCLNLTTNYVVYGPNRLLIRIVEDEIDIKALDPRQPVPIELLVGSQQLAVYELSVSPSSPLRFGGESFSSESNTLV
jgi:hypothetical protein